MLRTWSLSHRCVFLTLLLLPQLRSAGGLGGGGLCGCRGEHWHGLSLMMLLLRSSLAPPVMPITCPRRGNSGWEAPACGGLWGDLFLPLLLTQQNWCWNHSYFINTFTAIKNIIHRDPLLQLPCLYMHSTSHAHYFLQHVNT